MDDSRRYYVVNKMGLLHLESDKYVFSPKWTGRFARLVERGQAMLFRLLQRTGAITQAAPEEVVTYTVGTGDIARVVQDQVLECIKNYGKKVACIIVGYDEFREAASRKFNA